MNGIVYLNISGIFYIILIIITFFSKKRMKSLEQRIYSYLLIDSFFELLIGLFTTLLMYYSSNITLMIIFSKLYFITILLWIAIFSQYIFSLVEQKTSKLLFYIAIVMLLIVFFLPLEPVINESGISATGLSLYGLYVGTFLFDFVCIIYGFRALRMTTKFNKKLIPLWTFLIIGSIVSVIQVLNPEMFLLVPLEVFISSIMYHTIDRKSVV